MPALRTVTGLAVPPHRVVVDVLRFGDVILEDLRAVVRAHQRHLEAGMVTVHRGAAGDNFVRLRPEGLQPLQEWLGSRHE